VRGVQHGPPRLREFLPRGVRFSVAIVDRRRAIQVISFESA
jgi:hypothetical protein